MAYPTRQITGYIYTAGGTVITAGRITAFIQPPGATVLDTSGSPTYKINSKEVGYITASGVQSFLLTTLDSASPSDAYYQVHFELTLPYKENWYELWSIVGTAGVGLNIGDIAPIAYGPYLHKATAAPIAFSSGSVGPQGPAGAPGSWKRTTVQSLPTLTDSIVGYGYMHDRTPSSPPGYTAYDAAKTSGGTLVWVKMYELD
jgi:hypothetical protein